MTVIDYMYLINVACILFSAWVAVGAFNKGNNVGGWLNTLASAVNLAVVLNHYL